MLWLQVEIIAQEEKESQMRARQEQQVQQDQRIIAAHQNRCGTSTIVSTRLCMWVLHVCHQLSTPHVEHSCRRRGAELDEEEKAKRKETVDAAKSRLHNAEAQSRVNVNLQKILPVRRFGQGRRLFGSSMSTLRGGGLPNVKVRQGGAGGGAAPAAGPSAPGEADGGAQRPSTAKGSEPGAVKKTKQPLTMQDLLATLRHNPLHSHSQLHYQLQG